MRLSFLGAAETVTGSRFLVESGRGKVLVDCGLFQGLKSLRERNWARFPIDPAELDAVVLTHAHIDHSGYLPALIRDGFAGPVYCTPGTAALCRLLLPDAGYLQEEEARFRNRHRATRHDPALPLYTAEDGRAALERFHPIPFDQTFSPAPGLEVGFSPTGHILGAAAAILRDKHVRLAFSGDVGRAVDPIMPPPQPLPEADFLVLESTYGNRRHPDADPAAALAAVIQRTASRGGVVVIPTFAVGRAQALLHLLAQLKAKGEIPDLPVFLDSPMAISATEIFYRHLGEHRLSAAECAAIEALARCTPTPEDSMALNGREGPMIILSASGMATGGRVLHHLRLRLPDPKNTILFAGFQASGTRGEALLVGTDQVKIHGAYVPVRAEIAHLDALSAHADYAEMVDWLRQTPVPPRKTWLVHGEPAALDAMRRNLSDFLGWKAEIARLEQRVDLG